MFVSLLAKQSPEKSHLKMHGSGYKTKNRCKGRAQAPRSTSKSSHSKTWELLFRSPGIPHPTCEALDQDLYCPLPQAENKKKILAHP